MWLRGLKAHLVIPSIVSILILGTLGFSQDAFADPLTLFPTFVDSFSVNNETHDPTGLAFSPDGTKMFVVDTSGDDEVDEYTLSTAFDVSTASFVDSFSVSEQDTNPTDLAFSSDGAKMFVLGDDGDDVNEYTLSTAFDVSTASFVDSFPVAAQEIIPDGLAFSSDGTKMLVVGGSGEDVNEYTLSTAFDVSTASFVDSFPVAAQDTNPTGVAFSSDGTKMFVLDFGASAVNEYTLISPFSLFPTFVDSFSVAAQEIDPAGIAFSTDGTKMFVLDFFGEAVNEYTLSTAFDVSTASFVDSFSVAAQETNPTDVAFSSDGTKMFVVGFSGDDINEYTLSTAFDVSTASFVGSFSVAAQDTNPLGLAFSSDGAKMFVVGNDGDDVYEYTLSTAFDVSTASFVGSFSVAAQDTFPLGLAFSSDGAKMFVLGDDGDDVNEYTLHTTLLPTFVGSFSVAAQETSPSGIAFSSDGTKMFVVGFDGAAVYEYNISIPICSLPPSGDWTVSSTCILKSNATVNGNVIVPNGVVLTIPNGVTLDINFATKNLTVQDGGGVLIKAGGAIT